MLTSSAGAGFPIEEQGLTGERFAFYKVNALSRADDDDVIRFRDETVSAETAHRLGAAILPKGTLVMAKIGAALLLGRIRILGHPGCIDNNMLGLTPRSGIHKRFLMYVLQQLEMEVLVNPGAIPSLSERTFRGYRIPMPAPEVQPGIADFLDRETAKIDALIEKQNELVALLHERRRVLTYRNVLGQTAVPDAADSWFGAPPAHWSIDKLGRHTSISNGSTPSRENLAYWTDGHFPWLNSSNANHDTVTESQEFVTTDALRECHLPILHPGAVLVGITGQGKTRGMATLLGIKATINQHLAAVVPDGRYWDSRYLLMLVGTAYEELRRLSDEGGSTKGALTCADLDSFRVPRPPLAEQRAIVAFLSTETVTIDALIAKAGDHMALAKERRAALITAAVTGQIDVLGEAG